MCLAIPAQIVERINDWEGIVAWSDLRKLIGLALVPEAKVGDWVLVHTGYAIQVINAGEAKESLALFHELAANETDIE